MITEADIYWVTRLDYLQAFMGIAMFLLGIGGIIGFVHLFTDKGLSPKEAWRKVRIPLLLSAFLVVALVLTPTTKEMCAIKLIPKVVNSEGVQEIPEKLVGLSNEWLEELRPKKKGGK